MPSDTSVIEEPMPVAVIPQTAPPATTDKPQITPAQAKVEAVASLTMSAYQRAATLQLTPEESAALSADFPDEAFQPGAAGKENLIYIEHAHLRDRFNAVFGLGQWAIIPRNRWNEPFRTLRGTEGERVYVEAMLVVRGCFVGEAVGAMEYYPKNESQNYGDAVEGAKTAAFRRCAKEFGVGLQAWKKEWCEGWWQRRRAGKSAPRQPMPPTPRAPQPVQTATPASKAATKTTLQWMITQLKAKEGESARKLVTEYFVKVGALLPNEQLEDLPLRFVPTSQTELRALGEKLAGFEAGEEATQPFPPHEDSIPSTKVEVPRDPEPAPQVDAWRQFPMPFGNNAGVPLEELDKKYLFGLWANFQVETEYNGRPKKPETIAKDTKFRQMLDQAGEHYQFTKKS